MKKILLEEGSIVISKPSKLKFDFLPCVPWRKGDQTAKIKDGVLLKISKIVQLGQGSSFYEMQIITGQDQGDTVLLPESFSNCLEKIPSKRQPR